MSANPADTTDQYLWQPSIQAGAPDTLLGKPVYTDPNVAAVATSAKSVAFGDFSAYFVRQVNGILPSGPMTTPSTPIW